MCKIWPQISTKVAKILCKILHKGNSCMHHTWSRNHISRKWFHSWENLLDKKELEKVNNDSSFWILTRKDQDLTSCVIHSLFIYLDVSFPLIFSLNTINLKITFLKNRTPFAIFYYVPLLYCGKLFCYSECVTFIQESGRFLPQP